MSQNIDEQSIRIIKLSLALIMSSISVAKHYRKEAVSIEQGAQTKA